MSNSQAASGRSVRARALTVLARIIGKKRGVNIVFRGGVAASTDGKTIYLPALSDVATEEDAILLEGLLDHEAMHCRFTDFDFMALPEQQETFKKHPLMFPICNILEDVWGEREQAKVYPGCFQNIKKSVDVMINLGLYGGRVGQKNTAADALRGFVLHGLLGRLYENQKLMQFADSHKVNLISLVGQKLTDDIWALSMQVDVVKSTQEAIELAKKIFALIEDHLQKQPEESKLRIILQEMLQATPEGGDIATMLEEALQLSGGIKTDQTREPAPLRVSEIDLDNVLFSGDIAAFARPTAITLGTKLETLLEAKIDADVGYGKRGSKLSSRKLSGIGVGRTSIFRKEEEVEGIDTAIEVVLDLSSSMYPSWEPEQGHPHVVAKTASYAVAEILDRHEVPFAITAYGSSIAIVKSYEQSWRKRKCFLDIERLGGTKTTEVLQHSAENISLRPERKKMVILITDGDARDNTTVIPVMNELTALNVEFTSIFIGDGGGQLEMNMRDAGYPVVRAHEVTDLPTALFAAIKTAF